MGYTKKGPAYDMDQETLEMILDYSTDEIFVLDKERRIIFVNKKCERHYGLKPSQVLGRKNTEFVDAGYWGPSIVDPVFEKKEPVTIIQHTYLGVQLLVTAIPIMNDQNAIEWVVITADELQSYKFTKDQPEGEKSDQLPISDYNLITDSPEMKELLQLVKRVAKVDSTVLFIGESGTGKGVLARHLHQLSNRHDQAFLTINCAAIPEELLESELFGYAPGAFTGAKKGGKKGLIPSAGQGTVFLDEIGEISLKNQTKLLQLVQDHQFIPVGSDRLQSADVRVLAATNQDLKQLVREGKFREDLYYRLNVVELNVPPLRERPEDIIPLTYYYLNKFNEKYQTHRLISEESIHLLSLYSWPGNIRQLQNVTERSLIMSETMIQPSDLPQDIRQSPQSYVKVSSTNSLDEALENVTEELIMKSYKKRQSTRKVADDLKISQSRAARLLRKYKG